MPIRDVNTGKPLSGHELRKRRAERDSSPTRRRKASEVIKVSDDTDTSKLISWGARVQAAIIQRAMDNPQEFPNAHAQWRFISEAVARLGMIRDKAAEQEKLDRVAELTGKKRTLKGQGKPLSGYAIPQADRRNPDRAGAG